MKKKLLFLCFFVAILKFGYAQKNKKDIELGYKQTKAITVLEESFQLQKGTAEFKLIKANGEEIDIAGLSFSPPPNHNIVDVIYDPAKGGCFFVIEKPNYQTYGKEKYLYNKEISLLAVDSIHKLKWGIRTKTKNTRTTVLTKSGILLNVSPRNDNESFMFDTETGRLDWNIRMDIRTVLTGRGKALGESLKCIDLASGKIIWERNISNKFGWIGDYPYNTDTIFSMADGVHLISLSDGKGWSFEKPTGKKETGEMIGQILASAAIASATFAFTGGVYLNILPWSGEESGIYIIDNQHAANASNATTRTGLASNIKIEKKHLYFSIANRLYCLNMISGLPVWSSLLAEEKSGVAFVDVAWEDVLFINRGFSFKNRQVTTYITPYMQRFHKQDGRLICSNVIRTSHNPVLDYQLSDSATCILTARDLYLYDNTCQLFRQLSKSADSAARKKCGDFFGFLKGTRNHFFIRNQAIEKAFIPMENYHKGHNYWLLCKNGLACFDKHLNLLSFIPNKEVYYSLYQNNGLSLIINNLSNYSCVLHWIDKKGNVLAEIAANGYSKSHVSGQYLCLTTPEGSIVLVSIDSIDVKR